MQIYSIININAKFYYEVVLNAVNLGSDSYTIIFITGFLSGLYYGMEQVSKKRLDVLCENDIDE